MAPPDPKIESEPNGEVVLIQSGPQETAPGPEPELSESGESAQEPSEIDLSDSSLYLNRELTWLQFNRRVLHEACDDRVPLLERLKFLSITNSNLDEFIMKRIGGLKLQVSAGIHDRSVDGRTPREQIAECLGIVVEIEEQCRTRYEELSRELRENGIFITQVSELSEPERETLREHYIANIYPLVTPQAMDPAHPFPFVSNQSLNLLITLKHPKDELSSLARVKVPVGLGIPRFVQVSDDPIFVRLEDLIASNLDLLFPGMEIENIEFFRVTRNANTEGDEEQADDLLALIESEVHERMFAPVVRMQIGEGMSELHRGMLASELGLDEIADVVEGGGILGMSDVMELALLDLPDLRDDVHRPADIPELPKGTNIFHSIREHGSILLHHPYQSFTASVERFLEEAAHDPKVRAIKMTLYRTSEDTRVIGSLISAARNGKQVAVVVELKARFDESANIEWASRLESVGIHVTYGVVGLKTHCKVILVLRQDFGGLRRYAHVGTGNYHAGTARLYTDLGLLTADPEIGEDLTELFNFLTTGYKPRRKYQKILPAPSALKTKLIEKIHREIGHIEAGGKGRIIVKLNALEDADMTRALYQAARAGAEVQLLIRDTCRLRPGLEDLSENVQVISIVGRFLEHARIVYFENGGEPECYIGSADWMKRNLESRVECMVPIENPAHQKTLMHILEEQLGDERSAWEMQSDGSYVQRDGDEERCAHLRLARHAEKLSRRAKRLRKKKRSTRPKRRNKA
jgi:polyphosphate kinase